MWSVNVQKMSLSLRGIFSAFEHNEEIPSKSCKVFFTWSWNFDKKKVHISFLNRKITFSLFAGWHGGQLCRLRGERYRRGRRWGNWWIRTSGSDKDWIYRGWHEGWIVRYTDHEHEDHIIVRLEHSVHFKYFLLTGNLGSESFTLAVYMTRICRGRGRPHFDDIKVLRPGTNNLFKIVCM